MQCRGFVGQLAQHNNEFVQENAQILVILGEGIDMARQYAEALHTPFPVLSDPDRNVYHQFELSKNFIGLQRTATILVDPQGTIRYIKRSYNAGTWLQERQELFEAVQALKI
jgi:peroxiredoxin